MKIPTYLQYNTILIISIQSNAFAVFLLTIYIKEGIYHTFV